ncbi:MAG: SGNH/GDSL hydrolase family protein [Candidatus Omnitrophica bacterium]|nr:SGNH/GDSL hydrolase family protein [Candidatus Omnitrophota bacterium]
MRRRLAALLIGILLAVLVGEILLSQSSWIDNPPGQFQRSRTRAFKHVPNFKGRDRLGNPIRLNSQGYRDREYSFDKPEGVYRILVLGDSVAFGDGVSAEETFSDQLENLLNRNRQNPPGPVEVINTGIRGYNTYQELLLLKEEGLRYNPDLVLLCYVGNDAEPFSNQDGLIDKKYEWLIGLKDLVKQHSYLYAFFRKNLEVMRHRLTPEKFTEHYLDQFRPGHPGWDASYNALKQIKAITAERRIGFLLAVYPQLRDLGPGETYPEELLKVQRQIVEAGRGLSIDTLDLLPALQGHSRKELEINAKDWFHPNPFGHHLLAKAMDEHIRQKYLLSQTNQP